ncbi:MAG: hypothetical protein LBO76_07285 [Treponema sp.]|jgi:diaminopimelate epimerase|nr:hypothetical protein [Treponema sp.]
MELTIVRADPAGNITIFVLDRIADPALRLRAAKALLADPSLKAEQVGFVIPPDPLVSDPSAGPEARYWRLEMMGGEFCGNAARSFGLYAARETGARGKRDIRVRISGAPEPVPVRVDLDSSAAEAELPGPRAEALLSWKGRSFPVLYFEGIAHVIAEGLEPDRDAALGLADSVARSVGQPDAGRFMDGCRPADAGRSVAAVGVMFYDPARRFMRPAVYVAATGSLVFESSCGSGTAALAAYLSRGTSCGGARWEISQPGGTIEARLVKQGGAVHIGGPVSLGGKIKVVLPPFFG